MNAGPSGSPDDLALVAALEERAFAAWPAEEVRHQDGWRLRHMRGVTRRANSVWSNAGAPLPAPERPLADRLAEVEAFYHQRGQPPMFQLSPVAAPPGLDQVLEARGYAREAPVEVQVAAAAGVAAWRRPAPGVRTETTAVPTARWFEVSALRGRFAAVADVYRGLLTRLGDRALFVLAEHRGVAGAVGLGVVDRGWMGVFAMSTLPDLRRLGLGATVLAALAGAALERGVGQLYLQVESDNAAAGPLYATAGFRTAYRYHYRVGPRPAAPA